jgi:hypothetical protein
VAVLTEEVTEEVRVNFDKIKESLPKVIEEILKFVNLAREYSSLYGELSKLLSDRVKLVEPVRGSDCGYTYCPKDKKTFYALRTNPYPYFEPEGTITTVALSLLYGDVKLEVRYRSTSGSEWAVKYDLSSLSMRELIELVYNLGDVIGEGVAMLEGWKSKLASALEPLKALVAQVRLLTEPVQ